MRVILCVLLLVLSASHATVQTTKTAQRSPAMKAKNHEDSRDRCTAIGVGPKAMANGATVTTHSKHDHHTYTYSHTFFIYSLYILHTFSKYEVDEHILA